MASLSGSPPRRRKTASERRAQYTRADARFIQKLLSSFTALEHRGSRLSTLSSALQVALRSGTTQAAGYSSSATAPEPRSSSQMSAKAAVFVPGAASSSTVYSAGVYVPDDRGGVSPIPIAQIALAKTKTPCATETTSAAAASSPTTTATTQPAIDTSCKQSADAPSTATIADLPPLVSSAAASSSGSPSSLPSNPVPTEQPTPASLSSPAAAPTLHPDYSVAAAALEHYKDRAPPGMLMYNSPELGFVPYAVQQSRSNADEFNIEISLPPGTKAGQLSVRIRDYDINVSLASGAGTLLRGTLYARVEADESEWNIQGSYLCIQLIKRTRSTWPSLFRT